PDLIDESIMEEGKEYEDPISHTPSTQEGLQEDSTLGVKIQNNGHIHWTRLCPI
ncbi:hypothetical protein KI387_033710, partial [Taxus chinensis]